MNAKSIPWINSCKALCMLLVYLHHTARYLDDRLFYAETFYHPFYVNSFFFLSGYLLYRKQLSIPLVNEPFGKYTYGGGKSLFLNVVYRIAIPSVLFALIEFLPKKMIRGEGLNLTNMLVETFGGCTYWFTSALLVAELILLLLLLTRKKEFVFFFICAIIIWSIGVYLKQNSLYIFGYANFPWYYSRGMIAVLYLTMGGLYWKYEDRINSYIGKSNPLIVAVTLFLFVAAIWAVTQLEDNVLKSIGIFFRNLLGVFWVIRACLMVRENKWLSFIGINSLGFYLLSGSIPNILSILFCRMTFIPMPIAFTAVFLFSVVLAYVAVRIFTKYAPWLFDLRLLYRKR